MKDLIVPGDQAVTQDITVPAEYRRPPAYWVLGGEDGRTPVGTDDVMEWAKLIEEPARKVVRQDQDPENKVGVSTVFLGLDHSFGSEGGPVLFETMVFGGEYDGHMSRYRTWADAEVGHEEICQRVGINLKLSTWIDGETVESTEALTAAKDVTPKE